MSHQSSSGQPDSAGHGGAERFLFEAISVQADLAEPLFRQIETQLREAIRSGVIKPDERLPSTRRFAEELNVARNTVITAYEQLAIEGFIATRSGSGTRVAADFPQPADKAQPSTSLQVDQLTIPETRINRLLSSAAAFTNRTPPRPFRPHRPAEEDLSAWHAVVSRQLRKPDQLLSQSGDPRGYQPLREAIADYLGAVRGMGVDYQQVFITAGAQQGIELLAKVLLEPGDRVIFEDPAYSPATLVWAMAGADIVPVPVDDQGLDVTRLRQSVSSAKLVYTTPSSQFPLGMALSQRRRRALLQWASEAGAWIVEDDYNGEYRYYGRPLTPLYAMANGKGVIYMGSFSKLLTPGLRLGYLVVPNSMVEPLAQARWLLDRHSPVLEQAALTDFINEGMFARHLRKNRKLHRDRQQAMLRAATRHLQGIMSVPPLNAGLHLIGWLAKGVTEKKLSAAADKAGIDLSLVAPFCQQVQLPPAVILGFAAWTEKQIDWSMRKLGQTYRRMWVE